MHNPNDNYLSNYNTINYNINQNYDLNNEDNNALTRSNYNINSNSNKIIYPNSEIEYHTLTDHFDSSNPKKDKERNENKNMDKNALKQFMMKRNLDKIKELENEKEKLSKENKRLSKNVSSLNIEKEKLNQEKKKFMKERSKIIGHLRQREEYLLKLENSIQNEFSTKKQEIDDMKLQLKQEENILFNEKEKMKKEFNLKFTQLENGYKNKKMNDYNMQKEEEFLRQKEYEINNLKNQYINNVNNLNLKENELYNKERELQIKELNINNKYNQLMEKEQELSNQKNNIFGDIQNKENNFNNLAKELKSKEEALKNKEYQLLYIEKSLNEKENEIKNKENDISNRQSLLHNRLYQQVNEINNKENELNDKLDELNEKEKHLKKLKNEIEIKQNKIMELNNEYNKILENINSEKSKNENEENNINEQKYIKPKINVMKESNNIMQMPENNNENENLDIKDNDSYPENFGEDFNKNILEQNNQFMYDKQNNNGNNDNKVNDDIKDEYYDFDNYSNHHNDNGKMNGNGNNYNIDNIPLDGNIPVKQENIAENKSKGIIYKSADTMEYDNVPVDIDDINNSNGGDFNIKDSNNNQNSLNRFNVDDINEELFIEEYNPSLGLNKIENPKYINAILQTIAHIQEITEKIINLNIDPDYENIYNNLMLSKAYREFLINIFLPQKVLNLIKMPYNPKYFTDFIKNMNQNLKNDNNNYKEFINFLLSKLHEELNLNKNPNNTNLNISTHSNKTIDIKNENDALIDFLKNFTDNNNSIIVKNIYGIIKNTLYCHMCQNAFFNYHTYSYFNFNLAKIIEYKQNKFNKVDISIELNDCLDYFQKTETLLGDKALFCPKCKVLTESTSIKNIYSTKNILIFIFENIKEVNLEQNDFEYSEIINLRDYVEFQKGDKKRKEKFYLCGVVNFIEDNYGNEAFLGFCKMGKNNDWYCYDDENVCPVTFQEIKNNGFPIVLIYHKLIKK